MRSQNEERTQIFVIWSNYSGIDLYLWERRHPWRQACSRRQGWRRSRLSSYDLRLLSLLIENEE